MIRSHFGSSVEKTNTDERYLPVKFFKPHTHILIKHTVVNANSSVSARKNRQEMLRRNKKMLNSIYENSVVQGIRFFMITNQFNEIEENVGT